MGSRWVFRLVMLSTLLCLPNLSSVSLAADCQPPDVQFDVLSERQKESVKAGSKPDFMVFNEVCVDQETVIIYDPKILASTADEKDLLKLFPEVDGLQFLHRHAEGEAAAEAIDRANHAPVLDHGIKAPKHVYGYDFKDKMHLRMASERELANIPSEFSKCTVPVVIYQKWPHNIGEFFGRSLSLAWLHQQHEKLFDDRVSLVLAYPEKLPMEPFNYHLLQPFSKYQVSSFSDFSSRLPADTPSNATAEGRHIRCFEKMLVWRIEDTDFKYMGPAARFIKEHYRSTLPQVKVWGEDYMADDVMRVLIEQRPKVSYRSFLALPELLAACNGDGKIEVSGSRFKRVRCTNHTFGDDFFGDISLVSSTSVFVSMHGAGQANALFMEPNCSVLEVRPMHFGTWYKAWANHYQPSISAESDRVFYWFGLNMDDDALNKKSAFEEEQQDRGGDSFDARDRHVLLQWDILKYMLNVIAKVNRNRTAYEERWPHEVAYTLSSGGNISSDGDIWKQATEGPWSGKKARRNMLAHWQQQQQQLGKGRQARGRH